MLTKLSRLTFVIGLLCFILASLFIWQRYSPSSIAFSKTPEVSNPSPAGEAPASITLNRLGITLDLIPGTIENNRWPTTPEGLIYLQDHPHPGELGNSIIYGHNWPSLLGDLYKSEIGDKITVNFANGATKQFVVTEVFTVKPNQTEILENTPDTRLTIYTCTGFLDLKRLVIIAKP